MNLSQKTLFLWSLAALLGVACATAQSQGTGQRLTYDVVSIKPGDAGTRAAWSVTDDLSFSRDVLVRNYLMNAFHLRFADQLAGQPSWTATTAYTIQAKIGEHTVQTFKSISHAEQWKLRAQMDLAVLEDDFHLQWHRESRIRPVYELVPTKSGVKILLHPKDQPDSWNFHSGHLQAQAVSVRDLIALILANDADIDRVVLDRTQLFDLYDIDLRWTPSNEQKDDSANPTIFIALREQLGLELKPAKAPIEVVVIDSIEQPKTE